MARNLIYCDEYDVTKQTKDIPVKKNLAAAALSKLGASKGGIAQAKTLSAEKRTRIAQKGTKARWDKHAKS